MNSARDSRHVTDGEQRITVDGRPMDGTSHRAPRSLRLGAMGSAEWAELASIEDPSGVVTCSVSRPGRTDPPTIGRLRRVFADLAADPPVGHTAHGWSRVLAEARTRALALLGNSPQPGERGRVVIVPIEGAALTVHAATELRHFAASAPTPLISGLPAAERAGGLVGLVAVDPAALTVSEYWGAEMVSEWSVPSIGSEWGAESGRSRPSGALEVRLITQARRRRWRSVVIAGDGERAHLLARGVERGGLAAVVHPRAVAGRAGRRSALAAIEAVEAARDLAVARSVERGMARGTVVTGAAAVLRQIESARARTVVLGPWDPPAGELGRQVAGSHRATAINRAVIAALRAGMQISILPHPAARALSDAGIAALLRS